LPTHSRGIAGLLTPAFTPDAAANRSVIVGPDIVSFTIGVSAARREAITSSALLAQLVANRRVPDST
jgi:hypothetical protein